MKIKTLILTLLIALGITGCSCQAATPETSETVKAAETNVQYQTTSYFSAYPGITDISFNTNRYEDVDGQIMPVYDPGQEVSVSFAFDHTEDLTFRLVPMSYTEEFVSNEQGITISNTDGYYTGSFIPDSTNDLVEYNLIFTDGETDYFSAIVAVQSLTTGTTLS